MRIKIHSGGQIFHIKHVESHVYVVAGLKLHLENQVFANQVDLRNIAF